MCVFMTKGGCGIVVIWEIWIVRITAILGTMAIPVCDWFTTGGLSGQRGQWLHNFECLMRFVQCLFESI